MQGALASILPEGEKAGFSEAVAAFHHDNKALLSPAELGKRFVVPALAAEVQGEFDFADTDLFMEAMDWSLSAYPARLEDGEFSVRETPNTFEIDLDGNTIRYQRANEEEQLALDIDIEGWTPENLAIWLDHQVRDISISQSDMLRWVRGVVGDLTGRRKIHIAALMRCKFTLMRRLKDKITSLKKQAREGAYELFLFKPEARVSVSFDHAFAFRDGMYSGLKYYRGKFKFRKHFLGPDNIVAFDGAENGEEYQCAQTIDALSETNYWLRNASRHDASFWLPTSSDKFYPDFVVLLNDGRLLVIDYKGGHIADSQDTNEKRTIG
ncbi:MAG: restriction endonuclease subunit R, partial [Alphaproteobacteria bacterium]|nr:restriction endonuclease subunit R [Alphaproteobacteria bacterium]